MTDQNLLDPGFELTLRPMRYPDFYERYRDAIKNTWTVEEVDLHSDVADLARLSPEEQHLLGRLVAFFATGDSIVANNLVLTLYKHINSPEARLYLSRQLYEEAVHVQFYLTLLDTYLPDHVERAKAFAAVVHNPSFRAKSMHMEFAFAVVDTVRAEEPDLFDDEMAAQVRTMLDEAVVAELAFARDLCGDGLP